MTEHKTLEAIVSAEAIKALKAHDAERTGTLRLIKTALKNKIIEKRADLTKAEEEQTAGGPLKCVHFQFFQNGLCPIQNAFFAF